MLLAGLTGAAHVQALITAGRADIATGQTTVETLLNKIIGEQNTAAAAEAAAASALAAIESLTSEQQAAAESIANAYTASLQQIEVNHIRLCVCYTLHFHQSIIVLSATFAMHVLRGCLIHVTMSQ